MSSSLQHVGLSFKTFIANYYCKIYPILKKTTNKLKSRNEKAGKIVRKNPVKSTNSCAQKMLVLYLTGRMKTRFFGSILIWKRCLQALSK